MSQQQPILTNIKENHGIAVCGWALTWLYI